MFITHQLPEKRIKCLMFVCVVFILSIGRPLISTAMSPQESKSVIKQCITGIWAEEYNVTPELKKQQDALKSMLSSGVLDKGDLKNMAGDVVIERMGQKETSRYVFNQIEKPFDALFAPHLTWEKVKEVIWERITASAKTQTIITIGTLAPPGTPYITVPETTINPLINKLTHDKIKIKIFGGGVMGEDTDILRKMDIGQLTGCGCTALGVLNAAQDMSVFTLPGLFNNYDEVDYIFKKFRKQIDKSFEEKGYLLAALIDTGFFNIYSKKKIASIEDIRKNKNLTWMGQVETTLYEKLNINPTPVAVPEVISALSTGLADTNMAPAVWMLGMQGYQYASYFFDMPILYSPAAIIVHSSIQQKMQKELGLPGTLAISFKEFFLSEFNVLEPMWRGKVRKYESKAMEAFQKKCGIKAMPVSQVDRKTIEAADIAVREQLADKAYPRKLMEDVLKALAEYRNNNL